MSLTIFLLNNHNFNNIPNYYAPTANGLLVPRETAADIVAAAQAKVEAENQRVAAIGRGELSQAWVTDSLRSVGVLGKDETL